MEQVELGLTEHPSQAQQEAVVVRPRVVDPVGIGEGCAHDRSQIQQRLPGGVVPGQPAGLIGQHDPDVAQRHLRH